MCSLSRFKSMPITSEHFQLNLVEMGWPVSLLKFKQILDEIAVRQVVDVITQDPQVAANIVMIISPSRNRILKQDTTGDMYRLSIEKG